MKTLAVTFASVAAAVAALSYSGTAHALGPLDIEIAARVGYATNPSSSDFSTNPYGFGLGGRAGVSIFGIYGGISGIYYLGGSETVLGTSVSLHTAMEGFEAGYTLPIPFVKIRPLVGIGNSTITGSGGGVSQSSSNLYLEPGVLVFVPIGILTVGADINALILPSVDTGFNSNGSNTTKAYVSPSFHAQVGVRF
jgi:hypothetical protein